MSSIRTLQEAATSKITATTILTFLLAVSYAFPAFGQVNAPSWWELSDGNTISLGYLFDTNAWQPAADTEVLPSWYGGTTWTLGGANLPAWATALYGHNGVWGFTSGQALDGSMDVDIDNQARPGWIKRAWYQFDVYAVGAEVCCGWLPASGSVVLNEKVVVENLAYGWQRVTGSCDIVPQPESEKLVWTFKTDPSGKAAIDNVYFGTHCVVPEPASLSILLSAIAGLAVLQRRRR